MTLNPGDELLGWLRQFLDAPTCEDCPYKADVFAGSCSIDEVCHQSAAFTPERPLMMEWRTMPTMVPK